MGLMDTPRANQLHIGIMGKRNSGKSTLLNALTNQEVALVSDIAGTTTDPVYKSMEIHGIGPCVFIDTAGFDDIGQLGSMRVEKTKQAMEKMDIALMLFSNVNIEEEIQWIKALKKKKISVIPIINKSDILDDLDELTSLVKTQSKRSPVVVSAKEKKGMEQLKQEILRQMPENYEMKSITGRLAKEGDVVLLIMPQDIQAPKGRLILPQVQTIRDLLDKKCLVLSATVDNLDQALNSLSSPPDLIITDSQVFSTVYEKKPESSKLTSFSVLFANYKGDLDYFVECASAIERLTEDSKVLIAEACTHSPLTEDIGREKIPKMLKRKVGEKLQIDIVSGTDFYEDLSSYDLIIHCGGCMFNRKYVISRVDKAKNQEVPMSNYGVVLAYLSGILDKIDLK
ncbi:[FeFe] hydrogenase H-cluster maturation GTPase HydF [Alkalibaculum bacchi]|uniref:[FeFe] hydrogenase H-cluster maturation GTPase HydF n=1 Tax=Alkalibaculum bacchi TaxID=645887 RepID=UPI0026EF5513|nr:[FeFe] hydrogenase H-cluster maturation GTPase HydF [Alkalibaculum bacchi]